MLSTKVYLLAAAAIAAAAFALGQALPGAGVPLAIASSTLWVAHCVRRDRRLARSRD